MPERQLPYPAVFRDWRPDHHRKVGVTTGPGGVCVEMCHDATHTWHGVELTEDDASMLAAVLLARAGHGKLARRVPEEAIR